jgi:hypothetical protein
VFSIFLKVLSQVANVGVWVCLCVTYKTDEWVAEIVPPKKGDADYFFKCSEESF